MILPRFKELRICCHLLLSKVKENLTPSLFFSGEKVSTLGKIEESGFKLE